MRHEVECKYRLGDPAELVIARLAGHGAIWSDSKLQDDQAYAEVGWRHGMAKVGYTFARLRTENGTRTWFTVKEPRVNSMASLEQETEVLDRDAMHEALLIMGYRPTVRIRKTRRAATVDGIVICLDDVEGLGMFLEAEVMIGEDADAIATQALLHERVTAFGFDLERVEDTYDTLLANASGAASAIAA
ncbi:class IV adenylate cyclase [Glycomyces sp. YM15]|uniref:class IV adenylate cyclase n=1 Tax=Glycomyces sp. YM15 TaxID=2800446 RepID=UPI001965097C|nr:CYTH domain-containing protein [Glycomyces sp. YM15]